MNPVKPILREIRIEKWMNRAALSVSCVIGAVWLYLAAELFLRMWMWTSILATVLAFMQFRAFDRARDRNARLRELERKIRALGERLDRGDQ